jgi:hypothetical protein
MRIISAKFFDENIGADNIVPRFHFDDADEEEAADTLARLNRAARTAYQFGTVPTVRRLPNHSTVAAAALAALNSLDPAATMDCQYSIALTTAFVEPTEDPPANEMETAFRSIRDSGV